MLAVGSGRDKMSPYPGYSDVSPAHSGARLDVPPEASLQKAHVVSASYRRPEMRCLWSCLRLSTPLQIKRSICSEKRHPDYIFYTQNVWATAVNGEFAAGLRCARLGSIWRVGIGGGRR